MNVKQILHHIKMVEFAFHYLKSYEVMKNKYENNIDEGDVEAKVWCCQVSMSKNYKWLDIINFAEKNENDYNDYTKKSVLALYWSLS